MACFIPALPIRGQTSDSESRRIVPALRAGPTFVGIDTEVGPNAAVELTYVGSTPRVWRAGLIGGLFASTLGTLYGYGGLQLPVPLPLGLLARPSFSVGLYERGTGVELGHVLEFRSSFVLERNVSDQVAVSAMFYHLSNAGLGFRNPGLEAVGVAVAIPLSGETVDRLAP